MTEHFNKLTPASQERVAMLAEEAGEIVQVCGKILRHGLLSHHPVTKETNRDLLLRELTDLMAVMQAMEGIELPVVPSPRTIRAAWAIKMRFAHHQ